MVTEWSTRFPCCYREYAAVITFLLFSLLPPAPTPFINKCVWSPRSAPNSVQDAKDVMVGTRDKDPASQHSGLIRKMEKQHLQRKAVRPKVEAGGSLARAPRPAPSGGQAPPQACRRPHVPLGDRGFCIPSRTSERVDVDRLAHSGWLGLDN